MRHRRSRGRGGSVAVAVLIVALAAVGLVVADGPTPAGSVSRSPAGGVSSSPGGSVTRSCAGHWSCAEQARFAIAEALLAKYPGRIGLVVRDRTTGAAWRAGVPTHPIWTASTIKLAIAADVLRRGRSGAIVVDAAARKQIAEMLAVSSNSAASALWRRYGPRTLANNFKAVLGMKGLVFPTSRLFWGAAKCTADDLIAVMSYILEKMHPADRDSLVTAMRAVDPVQQWGVWGAGAALQPGVKGGWSVEWDTGGEHWVTNSVGFAGPSARYVVAVMYQLPPGVNTRPGSLGAGVHAISDLVAAVFGAPRPAAITVPDD